MTEPTLGTIKGASPRTDTECPECKRLHAVVEPEKKKWWCNNGLRVDGVFYYVCGAEGGLWPDGSLYVTRGGLHPQKD